MSAVVIQHPAAAAAPVANPRHNGRFSSRNTVHLRTFRRKRQNAEWLAQIEQLRSRHGELKQRLEVLSAAIIANPLRLQANDLYLELKAIQERLGRMGIFL